MSKKLSDELAKVWGATMGPQWADAVEALEAELEAAKTERDAARLSALKNAAGMLTASERCNAIRLETLRECLGITYSYERSTARAVAADIQALIDAEVSK